MNITPKSFNPSDPLFGGTFGAFMKVAFGLIIVVGIVADVAGQRERAPLILTFTAVMWTCTRIINEAFGAIAMILSKKEKDDAGG